MQECRVVRDFRPSETTRPQMIDFRPIGAVGVISRPANPMRPVVRLKQLDIAIYSFAVTAFAGWNNHLHTEPVVYKMQAR